MLERTSAYRLSVGKRENNSPPVFEHVLVGIVQNLEISGLNLEHLFHPLKIDLLESLSILLLIVHDFYHPGPVRRAVVVSYKRPAGRFHNWTATTLLRRTEDTALRRGKLSVVDGQWDLRGRGFSLLETITAIALLGLVVILVLNIFPSSVLAASSGNDRIQAENLARSLLEEARALAFEDLTLGRTPLTSPDPRFTVEREVYVPRQGEVHQTRAVRIVVRWSKGNRRSSISREVWLSNVRS